MSFPLSCESGAFLLAATQKCDAIMLIPLFKRRHLNSYINTFNTSHNTVSVYQHIH